MLATLEVEAAQPPERKARAFRMPLAANSNVRAITGGDRLHEHLNISARSGDPVAIKAAQNSRWTNSKIQLTE
ncbi:MULTISPECIES: hypothetical protein [Bradyrhizobium]|jgi:hypothetical protein|uniref:hypothetical protein n=1 Tax=Bradyrhizobium TaxID=374 RepID=UPI0012BC2CC9|nr:MULTISPECIES: hypothetical protein [Bradyrhizobium]MCS3447214.1 hypothetical protein [Bradyrhizobium elkanii]MCS3561650.1 hypothetical protein [Bradyrhizobium elkanii]MCW2148510.1 hypothetical protein [Bradyrhizobium elkanii]MCW2352403.1 hypothetical protein [Bradyrhizobium elkanii]MCW2372238.1 hypothetical protein [Bradyrhizobium elkanii]